MLSLISNYLNTNWGSIGSLEHGEVNDHQKTNKPEVVFTWLPSYDFHVTNKPSISHTISHTTRKCPKVATRRQNGRSNSY